MKKLIYLTVFALITLACSSNDSENTFLSNYDGVLWEEVDSDPSYSFRMIFHNNPEGITFIEIVNGQQYSDTYDFGVDYGDTLMTVNKNSGNTLILNVKEDIDGAMEDYTQTITVSGNNMTVTRSNEPSYIEYFTKG